MLGMTCRDAMQSYIQRKRAYKKTHSFCLIRLPTYVDSAKITSFLVIFLLLGVPVISTQANSNGKYNSTSGCSCHSQQVSSAPTPNHNFPATFNPGQTYSLSIGMTGGVSGTKGGFNLEVSDGTLSTGIGLMNVKVNSAGTQATHSISNDRSWEVQWEAPSSSTTSSRWDTKSNGGSSTQPTTACHSSGVACSFSHTGPRGTALHPPPEKKEMLGLKLTGQRGLVS